MSDTIRFRERLVPGWWVFAAVTGFIAMIAVAYGAVFGPISGWVLLTGGALASAILIIATSPVLVVTDDEVIAGRARLPRSMISEVRLLDREQVRAARGVDADARVFTMLRPSRSPSALWIALADPDDPHPAWLVTSRNPEALRTALQ